MNIKNNKRRKDSQEKIEREENMQEKHLRSINKICGTNYSTSREIEFEKILKTRRKKYETKI